MSLRRVLGGEVDELHARVNQLLDREDGLIVLVDGDRAISYAAGFGLSPCQLELVAVEIERALRAVAVTTSASAPPARQAADDAGRGDADDRRVREPAQGASVVMKGAEDDSSDDRTDGDCGLTAGPVLRLAAKTAPPPAR
jgi:hypothetical protein